MARKNQSGFRKHLDFVAYLQSSMRVPAKKPGSGAIASDLNTEDQIDFDLARELKKKFEELFGAAD